MFSETAGWSSVHFYKVLISNCLRIPSGRWYDPTPMSTLWQFDHCSAGKDPYFGWPQIKKNKPGISWVNHRLGSLGLQSFAYLYQPADECRFDFAGYRRNT